MDWDNKSEQDKIEYIGYLYFQRHAEEDWLDFNSMVSSLEESSESGKEEEEQSDNLGVED